MEGPPLRLTKKWLALARKTCSWSVKAALGDLCDLTEAEDLSETPKLGNTHPPKALQRYLVSSCGLSDLCSWPVSTSSNL